MIIDASAIVAIFLREPGFERLLARLSEDSPIGCAAPTLAEAGIVLSSRLGRDATGMLCRFIQEAGLVEIPFGADHWREAIAAWQRFGKGRHPAALNFGDCMTYATARLARQPLLCTGEDFSRTDIEIA